jgi:hypothetical protein
MWERVKAASRLRNDDRHGILQPLPLQARAKVPEGKRAEVIRYGRQDDIVRAHQQTAIQRARVRTEVQNDKVAVTEASSLCSKRRFCAACRVA